MTNVTRKGGEAIHFVETTNDAPPFTVGEEVKQSVDWERRTDHMQQHSGQHLITAMFDREFGFVTKSWWLGEKTSYVELDAKEVTKDHVRQVEKICNELIAAGTSVRVDVYEPGDPALAGDGMRSPRGLPDDVVGPIRVVTIDGVESNMCCGTHVHNLSQLQAVKLLNVEKTKNKLMVHFLVGNRVIKKLEDCFEREMILNNLLNGGPEYHIDLIKKLQANTKVSLRLLKNLSKEIAAYEAEKFKQTEDKRYYLLHRHDGLDVDFINIFLRNANSVDTLFFVTVGDETNKGQLLLQGPPTAITALGDKICTLLDGKGSGKGNRFQGKVNNLKKTCECDKLVVEYFAGQP